MRVLTLSGKVVSESATDLSLKLDGQIIDLRQTGDTHAGKITRPVDGNVAVDFEITGFEGTAWSLEVAVECEGDDPKKLFSRKGSVGKSGRTKLNERAPVPADPCGARDNRT
jgi:hypothetical protein